LENGDVVVVAQSVVSKCEGRVVDLRKITPTPRALEVAKQLGKDPREVEVILREAKEIVRLKHVLIARTEHGFVCANAGVDRSNVEPEHVTLLPRNPDASAKRIREAIRKATGAEVAVIVSDTQGRPFRRGVLGFAIGVAGMSPLQDLRGKRDLYGKELRVTIAAVADALAAAAVLAMGEAAEGTPVVVIRGAAYERGGGKARDLIRPPERDLFR
jgi:coenzyme F420-0:L-glutamate ligase/coenzyme F420-1:gamma-L-glutamate ligase